jgi:hypothetical protein
VASLEFNLDPADAARLAKRPGFRAGRSFPIDLTWHDTADGVLASEGLALCASAAGWQLSRLAADTPAGSPTVLADARRPDLLNHDLPGPLVPLARLHGVRRTVRRGQAATACRASNFTFWTRRCQAMSIRAPVALPSWVQPRC